MFAQIRKSSLFYAAFPSGVCPVESITPTPFRLVSHQDPVPCFLIDSKLVRGEVREAFCRALAQYTVQPGQKIDQIEISFRQCLEEGVPVPMPVTEVDYCSTNASSFDPKIELDPTVPSHVAAAFRTCAPLLLRELAAAFCVSRFTRQPTSIELRLDLDPIDTGSSALEGQGLKILCRRSYEPGELVNAVAASRTLSLPSGTGK